MKNQLLHYSKKYHVFQSNPSLAEQAQMPGQAYFIDDNTILALPSEEGDSRYPYGENGFNFWTYASGYMHCNEGLYSPFLRAGEGAEPKIAFFAGTSDEAQMFSLLSVPVMVGERDDLIRYTVFTMAATYYITETKDAIFGIRTFVDEDRQLYFTLEILNRTDQPIDVRVSSYFNPFLKNAMMENSTDRWFRVVDYKEDLQCFKIETYEERDRLGMATNYGVLSHAFTDETVVKGYDVTTSRYDYVGGPRSSLHTARVIQEGNIRDPKKITSFTETAICGDVMALEVTDIARIDLRFAYCFEETEANRLMTQALTGLEVDKSLQCVESKVLENQNGMAINFSRANDIAVDLGLKEKVFTGFIDHVKKQVEFCSVIKGYIQLSSFSLIGIRDVFQALEAYLFWQPEVVKAKMLEALSFLSPEGRLPRQYTLPASEGSSPAMDLRPFIDQGVWVISAITTYLRQTKDFAFLENKCGYYDFVDSQKHIAVKSDLKDTVLDHLLRIMDYLLAQRDHDYTKCVLALYGDWNDALDGLGKSKDPNKDYGTGVSVMASLQVYQNIDEMIEILETVGGQKYGDKIEAYKTAQEEIREGLHTHALTEDRILHGWGDEKSYRVGSACDPDGLSRDGLTSNSFWILSGLLRSDYSLISEGENKESGNESHKEGHKESTMSSNEEPEVVRRIILDAYTRLDSKYGLKTFHPHFEKGTEGVGRIPNLPKGTAENGATYIHASMFAVMSLFAIGESKLAWEQLAKLIPITHENISVSPFVVPNSYGLNEDLGIDGESMADWQTGSSNVLLKTVIRYVYGYEPAANGFYIQPSSHQPFDQLQMTVDYRGRKVTIAYEQAEVVSAVSTQVLSRRYKVNGEDVLGVYDSLMAMDRLHIEDDFVDSIEEGGQIYIRVEDTKE